MPILLALLALVAVVAVSSDTGKRTPPGPGGPHPPGPRPGPAPAPPPLSSRGAGLPDSFWQAYVAMCQRLGANPFDLATILVNESGFDPKASNPRVLTPKSCVGLNQLCPGPGVFASIVLGMHCLSGRCPDWDALSDSQKMEHLQAYLNLTAEQQLPFVEKYFMQKVQQFGSTVMMSARNIYWVNFLPATFRTNAPDSTVIAPAPLHGCNPAFAETQRSAYCQNKGFDLDGKGFITAGDLKRFTDHIRSTSTFQAIARRIQANSGVA